MHTKCNRTNSWGNAVDSIRVAKLHGSSNFIAQIGQKERALLASTPVQVEVPVITFPVENLEKELGNKPSDYAAAKANTLRPARRAPVPPLTSKPATPNLLKNPRPNHAKFVTPSHHELTNLSNCFLLLDFSSG